jgi:hypothetical protein
MDEFEYLAALMSVVAGLGLARALSGVASILDSGRSLIQSDVHIVWTFNILIWLVGFWWFTFMLSSIDDWTVSLLLFVLIYGALIYLLVALLHPNSDKADTGSVSGFIVRRRPFFATFMALGLFDVVDTLIKTELLKLPGPPERSYWILMALWIVLGATAWRTTNRIFHRGFAYCWFAITVLWNLSTLDNL